MVKEHLPENAIYIPGFFYLQGKLRTIFWVGGCQKPLQKWWKQLKYQNMCNRAKERLNIWVPEHWYRSIHSQIFLKIGVFKTFALFTGKYLCWSLSSVKLQAWKPETVLKRDSNTYNSDKQFVLNKRSHLLKHLCDSSVIHLKSLWQCQVFLHILSKKTVETSINTWFLLQI